MIAQDPLSLDAANKDFHLSAHSPCINRGSNHFTQYEDYDGDEKPNMGTIDIGIDEYMGLHALSADTFTLSESIGGVIDFTLDAGVDKANRKHLMLAGITGDESRLRASRR